MVSCHSWPLFYLQEVNRWTALHYAAIEGRLAIAKRLLEGGADPTLGNNVGMTALDYARREGKRAKSEVVALLSEPRYAMKTERRKRTRTQRPRHRQRPDARSGARSGALWRTQAALTGSTQAAIRQQSRAITSNQ